MIMIGECRIKLHVENVNVIRIKKILKRWNKHQLKHILIIKMFIMIKTKK